MYYFINTIFFLIFISSYLYATQLCTTSNVQINTNFVHPTGHKLTHHVQILHPQLYQLHTSKHEQPLLHLRYDWLCKNPEHSILTVHTANFTHI